jgi:hypothetical protein
MSATIPRSEYPEGGSPGVALAQRHAFDFDSAEAPPMRGVGRAQARLFEISAFCHLDGVEVEMSQDLASGPVLSGEMR